jgi:hypothetical protein
MKIVSYYLDEIRRHPHLEYPETAVPVEKMELREKTKDGRETWDNKSMDKEVLNTEKASVVQIVLCFLFLHQKTWTVICLQDIYECQDCLSSWQYLNGIQIAGSFWEALSDLQLPISNKSLYLSYQKVWLPLQRSCEEIDCAEWNSMQINKEGISIEADEGHFLPSSLEEPF